MLESLVASILNRIIGSYVENFDRKQLNIGIWSGDVTLRNLKLRPEALDKFDLPLHVLAGHLGELTLQIPWSNLKSKPVKIAIKDLYLLATPGLSDEYDEEAEKAKALARKRTQLESLDAMEKNAPTAGLSSEEVAKNESFNESLISKIIDNLQITISHIHVRYEETASTLTAFPYTVGITLTELSAVSANADWKPDFISISGQITHKLITLDSLAVYFATGSAWKSLQAAAPQEMEAAFEELQKQPQHILRPISGTGRVLLNKGLASDAHPKTSAQLFFDEIAFRLDDEQYRDALAAADRFHWYFKTRAYKRFRPRESVAENPRAWLVYAARAVHAEVHRQRYEWSWEYFASRRDQRKRYIELYKQRLLGAAFSPEDAAEFAQLQDDIAIEDIRFYRGLAKAELRRERHKLPVHPAKQAKPTSWWNSWWGSADSQKQEAQMAQQAGDSAVVSGVTSGSDDPTDTAEPLELTEEQRKELYDTIGYSEDLSTLATDYPRDRVLTAVTVTLNSGSLRIEDNPHTAQRRSLAALVFEGFHADFLQRRDSARLDLSLREFRVEDGCPESLYQHIISVKSVHHGMHSRAMGGSGFAEEKSGEEKSAVSVSSASASASSFDRPFFEMSFESNPLDGSADSALAMRSDSLTIFYHASFLESLLGFFKPPEDHLDTIGAIMSAAEATVETVTQQTRMGLEYALETHKTVKLSLDLQAPLIILPVDFRDAEAPCGVVDAGHIRIESDLAPRAELDDLQARIDRFYADGDWETLRSLVYDRFTLQLENTQVLIGPSLAAAMTELHRPRETAGSEPSFSVLDRLNVAMRLELSVLPQLQHMPRVRVSGTLPRFRAAVSDEQYRTLMRLVDVCLPEVPAAAVATQLDAGEAYVRDFLSRRGSTVPLPDDLESEGEVFSDAVSDVEGETEGETEEGTGDATGAAEVATEDSESDTEMQTEEGDAVADPRDSASVSTASDPDPDSDAASASDASSVSAKESATPQKQLEFILNVHQVVLSLYRSDPQDPAKADKLIDIIGDQLRFCFAHSASGMLVNVVLAALTVDDFIDQTATPEFSKLVSSPSAEETAEIAPLRPAQQLHIPGLLPQPDDGPADNTTGGTPLFSLQYTRSPLPDGDGFDQAVKLDLQTLQIVVTRSSWLTLLNFALMTFAPPNAAPPAKDGTQGVSAEPTVGRLAADVALRNIVLVLNDDGVRLATIRLSEAAFGVDSVGEEMRVAGSVGALAVHDDVNAGAAEESVLRQLVSLEASDLLDFQYETFGAARRQREKCRHTSELRMSVSSVQINFIEEPMARLLQFLSRFQQMKQFYDTARLAALNQVQTEEAQQMQFDVRLGAPTVVFPRVVPFVPGAYDMLTVQLGEVSARNEFRDGGGATSGSGGGDAGGETTVNLVSLGLKSTSVRSEFQLGAHGTQKLEILDNLDISFDVSILDGPSGTSSGTSSGGDEPKITVAGRMADVEVRLTDQQLAMIMEVATGVSSTLASLNSVESDPGAETEAKPEAQQTIMANDASITESQTAKEAQQSQPQSPQPFGTSLEAQFVVSKLSLTLFLDTADQPTVEHCRLTTFALNDIGLRLKQFTDGNFKANFHTRAFTVSDVRPDAASHFPEIIPPSAREEFQFLVAASSSGTAAARTTNAAVSVDSPRVILSLDYLFLLQRFVENGFWTEDLGEVEEPDETPEGDEGDGIPDFVADEPSVPTVPAEVSDPTGSVPPAALTWTVNIVDCSVFLLADPQDPETEALVFKLEQLLVAQHRVLTVNINNVGMYLRQMQADAARLQLLDDFSASASVDRRSSDATQLLTKVCVAVEPLLFRVSLWDVQLALTVLARASAAAERSAGAGKQKPAAPQESAEETADFSREFKSRLRRYARSVVSATSSSADSVRSGNSDRSDRSGRSGRPVRLQGETLTADFQGLRIVLIGALHELPVLDFSVRPFTLTARNWSNELVAELTLESHMNVFNYARSAWEPLVEPWVLGVHVARPEGSTVVDVVAGRPVEVAVTVPTLQLLAQLPDYVRADSSVLTRGRGAVAPYELVNQTGYSLEVVADQPSGVGGAAASVVLDDGESVPWAFEDWRAVRENLSVDGQRRRLRVRLVDSSFGTISGIPVSAEGEEVFVLRPKADGVFQRLVAEVVPQERNVKRILLRSSVKVRNETNMPVEIGCLTGADEAEEAEGAGYRQVAWSAVVAPGEARAVPIRYAYRLALVLRPPAAVGYEWSGRPVLWRSLLERSDSVSCSPAAHRTTAQTVFFGVSCDVAEDDPLARVYPHLEIKVAAPLKVENQLPYDVSFAIQTGRGTEVARHYLAAGGTSEVYSVDRSEVLALTCEIQAAGYGGPVTPAVIHVPDGPRRTSGKAPFFGMGGLAAATERADGFEIRHTDGQRLRVNLVYEDGGEHVMLRVDYVIRNCLGRPIRLVDGGNAATASVTGGEAQPLMFSFLSRKPHPVALQVPGCETKPISLEMTGNSFEVSLAEKSRDRELLVGIHAADGPGRYSGISVVTLTPRYVLKSHLSEPILLREHGSGEPLELGPGSLLPVYFLARGTPKLLTARLPGQDADWSAPFRLGDEDVVYLKLLRRRKGYTLLKLSVLTEDATQFVHVAAAGNRWPFAVRNFSSVDFTFYQSVPKTDAEAEAGPAAEAEAAWISKVHMKPVYFRLNARSTMQYAWDCPALPAREITLVARGRARRVPLERIGTVRPLRLPASPAGPAVLVEIAVVADGPTQCLVISEAQDAETSSLARITQSQLGADAAAADGTDLVPASAAVAAAAEGSEEEVALTVTVQIAGIGVSLVNRRNQELCYVTARGLQLEFRDSELYQTASVKLKWLQIDNQLYGCVFPILLYPSVVPKTAREMDAHPFLSALVSRVKDASHGLPIVQLATLLLQEVSLETDEDFVYALVDFLQQSVTSGDAGSGDGDGNGNGDGEGNGAEQRIVAAVSAVPEPTRVREGTEVYFETLYLHPAQLNLTFVRAERLESEAAAARAAAASFSLFHILTMALGNVNNAPIRLNCFYRRNFKAALPILLDSVKQRYLQDVIYQTHKIVGSADILGNPIGLFSNISSGMMDLFYEPYQGYVLNDRPQELGMLLAKGGLSLVKKSVFGFSDSFARFSGSVSKGLTAATMDRAFQEQRRLNLARNRPSHAVIGFTAGASSLIDGVASGINGLATAPLEGARKEGSVGFLKGLGKGLVGLPTKTAIGFFDFTGSLSAGLRNTTAVFDANTIDRVRLPRFIPADGILRPYSVREAQGQYWLKNLDEGAYFQEQYVAHVSLPGEDLVALVTYSAIMLASVFRMETQWVVRFDRVAQISQEPSGISIKLKGGKNGPFIPVPDVASRTFLYNKIGVAVEAYNRKFQLPVVA